MLRKLANAWLPPVGLGCMGMSEFYGRVNDAQSLETLSRAYEIGYRHFDTADMYGSGHNEALLGKFIRSLGADKKNIFVATKGGIRRDARDRYKISVDNHGSYLQEACTASLRRLGLERIDLYYVHRHDPKTPIEETMGVLEGLVKEGKIGAIGLCEVSVETLRKATRVYPVAAVQSEYSLWTRDPESDVFPACKQMGVAFVAFSPLGRGFLPGALTREYLRNATLECDLRQILPRFSDQNFDKNMSLVRQLGEIAGSLDLTASELALAWALSKQDNIHVIPGTKRILFAEENFRAKGVILTDCTVKALDSLFFHGAISGQRYPESLR